MAGVELVSWEPNIIGLKKKGHLRYVSLYCSVETFGFIKPFYFKNINTILPSQLYIVSFYHNYHYLRDLKSASLNLQNTYSTNIKNLWHPAERE